MFNAVTVQDAFITLAGWQPDLDPSVTQNPMGDLLTATSGLYYNDKHSLLTIENLKQICDVFEDYTYAAYSALTSYSKGIIVTSASKWYISLQNSNLGNVVTDTAYWRETNPFNEWLRNKTMAGIIKCVNDVMQLKKRMRTAANLLSRSQVLKIPGYNNEVVGDTEAWLGWRIMPTSLQDIIVTIDRISLHLQASEDCVVNLYKNGSSTAEATTTIVGDGNDSIIWKEVNWPLERGSYYYLAYNKTALATAVPINGLSYLSGAWCTRECYPGTQPFVAIQAFNHAGPLAAGWSDVSDISVANNNYGLNAMISAKCDYTELLVDQKELFVNPVMIAVAMILLRELAYNPKARINRNQGNIDSQRLLFEIDGDTLGRAGSLRKDYDEALNLVTFDDRKLSSYCLPCKRSGIRQLTT